MASVYMGPYPARFSRVPPRLTGRLPALPPNLALSVTPSLPRSLGLKPIAAASWSTNSAANVKYKKTAATTALTLRTSPMEPATVSTCVLTQVVQWQKERGGCASAGARDDLFQHHRSYSPSLRSEDKGDRIRAYAGATTKLTGTEAFGRNPLDLSSCSSPEACTDFSSSSGWVDGQGANMTAAEAASLHMAKRQYSTAATTAAPPSHTEVRDNDHHHDSNGHHAKAEKTKEEEAEENAEVLPSFEEIYAAFRTLELADDDGRALRSWTLTDVKRAYHDLARKLHPDLAGGDAVRMEEVNTAYECLLDLSTEVAEEYASWLGDGGEARCLCQEAADGVGWGSGDLEPLMLVGWFTTLSGAALYAGWQWLCAGVPVVSTVSPGGTAAASSSSSVRRTTHTTTAATSMQGAVAVDGHVHLTLRRAGTVVTSIPGVQYGVMRSNAALLVTPVVSLRMVRWVRATVSRYALTMVVAVAACVNTLMMQRILMRAFAGVL